MATTMKVSLDDGETFADVSGDVRVIYEDVPVLDEAGDETTGELHVTLTAEGLILDVWTDRKTAGDRDRNLGTSSETVDEIIGRVVEDDG